MKNLSSFGLVLFFTIGLSSDAFFLTNSSGKYRQISYSETGIYYNNGQTLTNAYGMRCVKDY